MEITSQGLLSEFIFHDFAGVETDHGDCISVRTPANPDYFYGNFLIFPLAPQVGDFDRWRARFAEIFADTPAVRHVCFQWASGENASAEALAEFKAAGFNVGLESVLTAQSVRMDKAPTAGISFRPLRTDSEWLGAIDAQTDGGFPQIPKDEYRRYKEATFAQYRTMSEAGLGDWWGAFNGGEMVADLGLFFGRGIGRFQSVETREDHRRQGICRSLVHHVSKQAFAAHPGITLMIHADADEMPERIYKSLGYRQTERIESAFRPPIVEP